MKSGKSRVHLDINRHDGKDQGYLHQQGQTTPFLSQGGRFGDPGGKLEIGNRIYKIE